MSEHLSGGKIPEPENLCDRTALADCHQPSFAQYIPYEDQWAFLSSVRSLSEGEVNKFIKTLDNDETGGLFNDNSEKPWEIRKQLNLQDTDFPSKINIVLANMIFIEKSGISSKGITYLKRLPPSKIPISTNRRQCVCQHIISQE